jgi:hypothetical protein
MTQLLLDRTIGMLLGYGLQNNEPFVCVHPRIIESDVKAWVVLTRAEFLSLFAPQQGVHAQ